MCVRATAPRLTLQPAPLLVDHCGIKATPTSLLRSDGSVLFDSPVFSVTPQPRGSGKQLHVAADVAEVRASTVRRSCADNALDVASGVTSVAMRKHLRRSILDACMLSGESTVYFATGTCLLPTSDCYADP